MAWKWGVFLVTKLPITFVVIEISTWFKKFCKWEGKTRRLNPITLKNYDFEIFTELPIYYGDNKAL